MNSGKSFTESFRDIALVVMLFAIGVSYHPIIVGMSRAAGYENGTILSRYILLLFVGVFGLSLVSTDLSVNRSKTIRTSIVWILVTAMAGLLALAIFNNKHVVGDVRSLVIVLAAIIIGWKLNPSRKMMYALFLSFAGSVLFSGLSQVMINIGGFVIEDQYLTDAKNSLGALLASASLVFLYIVHDTESRFLRLASIVAVAMSLLLLLVIRARMSTLTAGLLIVYYCYLRSRNSMGIVIAAMMVPLLLAVFMLLPDTAFDFFYSSMTTGTQGEDFTSGRLGVYQEALLIVAENPLLGNIRGIDHIGWVHNFPFLKLSGYGLLFSWPILAFYIIIGWKALSRSYRFRGVVSFFNLLLLVPYLISMAEPTFPFGPGTVTVFNFLLFGIAERTIITSSHP